MIAISTVLVAFPVGLFLRNRLAAFVTFLALYPYASTAILTVGCALVVLGHHLGRRRRNRAHSADLDPARH